MAGIECNVCCWPAVADGNDWALVGDEAAGIVPVVVVVKLGLEAHELVVVAEAEAVVVVAGGIVGAVGIAYISRRTRERALVPE